MSAGRVPGPRLRELSPRGRGGVSVLLLEGPGALERARELLPGVALELGVPVYGRLWLPEAATGAADEAVACALEAGRVELHVHGSPALVRELRARLGGDEAEPEEPASQAGLARALLPRAASEAGARILLDQVEGALARELARLVEAPDPELARGLAALARRSEAARRAIEPATVLLAGPVNAGKSTLFNALLGARRASVSDEPGTTRDALTERALLGAYPVDLVDTAGERALAGDAPPERVERAAQELARELAREADLVLWLRPPGTEAPPPLAARVLVLASRADLEPAPESGPGLRALEDPEGAREEVRASFSRALRLPSDPWEPGRAVLLGEERRAQLALLFAQDPAEQRAELARWLVG